MKYKSITINEEMTNRLVRHLTKLFAAKEVKFGDFTDLTNSMAEFKEELSVFEKSGLIEQKLFERPFQWVLDVPDEPKLYDFYRFALLADNVLVRIFRTYHMKLITQTEMKVYRSRVEKALGSAAELLR